MEHPNLCRVDNILVIVDPTATEHPSVRKAYCLAQRLSARVELYVCETAASREARFAAHLACYPQGDFAVDLHPLLQQLAEPGRKLGLDVSAEVEFRDPLHAGLIDRTKRTSADLVIKDTHAHSLLQRTFLTNTDWQLIRDCPVPLLLVRPTIWAEKIVIAAAVDPTHVNDKPHVLDDRILDWSSYLSCKMSGSMQVLHAFIPLPSAATLGSGGLGTMTVLSSELVAKLQQQRLQEVDALARSCKLSGDQLHVRMGVPTDVLPVLVQDVHADVLALGAISRSGLQRLFIGSTAEKLLDRISCDLLVVKSPDFASDFPVF